MRRKSAAGWTWQAGLVDNVPLSTTKVVTRSVVHNAPEIQGIDELTTGVNKSHFNILRSRQNRRRYAHDIFKCIFLNENVWNSINIH